MLYFIVFYEIKCISMKKKIAKLITCISITFEVRKGRVPQLTPSSNIKPFPISLACFFYSFHFTTFFHPYDQNIRHRLTSSSWDTMTFKPLVYFF